MASVTKDRFGNDQMIIGLKDKKGTGFGKGYFEVKGTLFKVEVSPARKEGVTDWVKITKVDRTKRSKSF